MAGLSAERDLGYILPRILEFGRIVEVRWAIAIYGLERIHRFLKEKGHPELSERTLQFWRAVFRAKEERWKEPPGWRKSKIACWPT
jgi:hypothetical protein